MSCAAKPAAGSKKKSAAVDGAEQKLKPRTISAYVRAECGGCARLHTDACTQTVFCAERRPELKLEQPKLPFGELSKVRLRVPGLHIARTCLSALAAGACC